MFEILGWMIVGVIVALGGFYLFMRYIYLPTSDPYGLTERGYEVMRQVNDDMRQRMLRDTRTRDLRLLERDLDAAEKLMRLERRHHELAEQYAAQRRRGYQTSSQRRKALEAIANEIERLKTG